MPDVYIPYFIMQDKELNVTNKMVYGELTRWVDSEGLCDITKHDLMESFKLTKPTITRALNRLKAKKYIQDYEEGGIVEKLQSKNMKGLGIGKKICLWCKVKTYVTHSHHYPIRKEDGGTETIEICPNCHHEFHFHENRIKLILEPEQIQYIIENRGR